MIWGYVFGAVGWFVAVLGIVQDIQHPYRPSLTELDTGCYVLTEHRPFDRYERPWETKSVICWQRGAF